MQTDPEVDVDDDTIFKDPKPASQPTRDGGSNRKGRARGGARGGVRPSIQRKASQWEGVTLKGSQTTAVRGGQAVTTPVNSGKVRGRTRGRARKASGSSKASLTTGITKNTRGSGQTTRSSGQVTQELLIQRVIVSSQL